MHKFLATIISLLFITTFFGQEKKKDTLGTEEILVVKSYTPTIKNASKINTKPTIDIQNSFKRKEISYSIFSIPVASTFTPSKGKAKGVTRLPKERIYQNYISGGFGTFTSPFFEAYFHTGDAKYNDFGMFINHFSSKGGLTDVVLDNNFSNTSIEGFYTQFERDFLWKVTGGLERKQHNYYGIPVFVNLSNDLLSTIDEEQIYKNIFAKGEIAFDNSFFKGALAEVSVFSDAYSSNEYRITVKPKVEFPISNELISAEFFADLLTGKFEQQYNNIDELKYSYFNFGVYPAFEVLRDNFTLSLGAKLVFNHDLENKTSTFFAYPNISSSLNLVSDVVTVIAGVTGNLEQHSYQSLSNENPFVSPTLQILPTDNSFNVYGGLKGKLASTISFLVSAKYADEKNKALFKNNPTKTDGTVQLRNAFEAGNSFSITYDDVTTLSIHSEITIDVSKQIDFSASATYFNYATTNELEAWNLPDMVATANFNYKNKSWFAGAKLYYNGVTKDYVIPYEGVAFAQLIENESYLDLNINGGYHFSDRLTVFGKINNALGEKYHPFVNYQVQPLQLLAGLTYKFDL